jgi:tetratricopeptide (TPR) repeat protein
MVPPPNLAAADLSRAQQLARSGDLNGASRICADLLARDPRNFPALLILGGIQCDRKNFPEAEKLLQRAVKLNPRSPEALGSYGNVLIELGRRDEGARALSEAIRLQPQNPATYVYRGYGYAQSGDHRKALQDFDAAVRLAPNWEFALHNRATALVALYRHKEALPDVENLLHLHPDNPTFLANYGTILTREGRHQDALAAIERALQQQPGDIGLQTTRADILAAMSRYADALSQYEHLLTLQPDNPQLQLGCAHMYMEQQKLEPALERVEKLIATQPNYGPGLVLKANLLLHLDRHEESFAAYDTAVARAPEYPEGSYHRGSMLLLHGRFIDGWRDFERRWDVTDCGLSRPELKAPAWRGEALNGRSIVVYSEQGLGDTIQFARFLPQLLETGARVTFLCHSMLMRLLKSFPELGIEIVATCQGNAPFDFQCALMSLPQRFETTPDTIPGTVPYIFPEPDLVRLWHQRLGRDGFKIGICWQGNPAGAIDKGRSVPLTEFGPIAAIKGVRLISLQRKHGVEQLAHLPDDMRVETVSPFDDGKDAFIDTAAIMENLDLVITSDTSVAHLAGALGRPVWLATKHIPDWRWMLGRSDSPWYPTMRLFRQAVPGDWTSVFAQMADALDGLRRPES